MSNNAYPQVCIIGGGISGITAALRLRDHLGINSFTIFERNAGVGGVWWENTYPGAACDVPSTYYSSANTLNPNWSSNYSGSHEIQAYWAKLHSKQGLEKHTRFHHECKRAVWNDGTNQWTLTFTNLLSGENMEFVADIVIAGVGGFSIPNMQTKLLPGIEAFRGPVFHTSRWDHTVDLKGKRVAVIGNGCSAAQLVPALSEDSSIHVINFVRTPQWYMPRDNAPFSAWTKWVYRNVPLVNRLARWNIFLWVDQGSWMFRSSSTKLRSKMEKISGAYIRETAPEKYMNFLMPTFPIGAKRIIYDPGYLASLHRPNVDLVYDHIAQVTQDGVILGSGEERKLDVIVLATGFDTVTVITSIDIQGRDGANLKQIWDERGGPEAYYASLVPKFPNLFMIVGPNSITGFQSVIFFIECQVRWCSTVIQHMLKLKASYVEPKPEADKRYQQWMQKELRNTVYAMEGSPSSWYKTPTGKNHTVWPMSGLYFYWMTMFPKWGDMDFVGARKPEGRMSIVLTSAAVAAAVVGSALYRFGLRL